MKTAQDHDAPLRLIEATIAINEQRKRAMGRKVIAAMGGEVRGRTVAVLGLTFKPNTDDMRDAPSIAIIQALQDAGAKIRAYDPEGMAAARAVLVDVDYAVSAHAAAAGASQQGTCSDWAAFSEVGKAPGG